MSTDYEQSTALDIGPEDTEKNKMQSSALKRRLSGEGGEHKGIYTNMVALNCIAS